MIYFYVFFIAVLIGIIFYVFGLKQKNKTEKILDFKLTDSKLALIKPSEYKIKIKSFDSLLLKQIKRLNRKYLLVAKFERKEEALIKELFNKADITKYFSRCEITD